MAVATAAVAVATVAMAVTAVTAAAAVVNRTRRTAALQKEAKGTI